MKYIITLFLLTISIISSNTASALSNNESSAEDVLNRYFLALSQGDTATLKSLMTGDFLKKRSHLLDNPTYPAYLTETYGNATSTIDNIKTTGSSDIVIDASISFDEDNVSHRRFFLRLEVRSSTPTPTYYIYDETQAD